MSELRLYLLAIGILILLAIYFFGRKRHVESSHDVFADSEHEAADDALMPTRRVPSMENPGLFSSAKAQDPAARQEPRLNDWDDPTEETDALPEPVELTDRVSKDELLEEFDEELPPLAASRQEDEPESEPESASQQASAAAEASPAAADEEEKPAPIFVMYVVARQDKPIIGAQAVKAFHIHKLRFGKMDIFHRQIGTGEQAKTLFSVANMLKPGTLVPDEISNRELKGLSLFMNTEGMSDPRGAYDDMLHVAQQLAYTLEADLRDSSFQPLTSEKIAEQRQMLRELKA